MVGGASQSPINRVNVSYSEHRYGLNFAGYRVAIPYKSGQCFLHVMFFRIVYENGKSQSPINRVNVSYPLLYRLLSVICGVAIPYKSGQCFLQWYPLTSI